MKKFGFPLLLAAVVGAMIIIFAAGNKPKDQTNNQTTATPAKHWADNLPGLMTTTDNWAANRDQLKDRLAALATPALGAEGNVVHIHQHIDIYIHGQQVSIPQEIGIGPNEAFISIVHTHDPSGIIHVESPHKEDFYLGQFFAIWGLDFGADRIGGYKAEGDNQLRVYVNGSLYGGDPRDLKLEQHQEIVITFGTEAELPNPIPASYEFPKGL